jgi:hypothetical protein
MLLRKNDRDESELEKNWGQVQIFSFSINLAVYNKPFKIPPHLPFPKGGEEISPF